MYWIEWLQFFRSDFFLCILYTSPVCAVKFDHEVRNMRKHLGKFWIYLINWCEFFFYDDVIWNTVAVANIQWNSTHSFRYGLRCDEWFHAKSVNTTENESICTSKPFSWKKKIKRRKNIYEIFRFSHPLPPRSLSITLTASLSDIERWQRKSQSCSSRDVKKCFFN